MSYRGLYAGGALDLDSSACTPGPCGIELGDVQEASGEELKRFTSAPSFGFTTTATPTTTDQRYGFGDLRVLLGSFTEATANAPTVQTVGSQRYVGPVTLTADTQLAAGGGVMFVNNVESVVSTAHNLDVSAGGTTTFGGNVGNATPLGQFKATDATFTAADHTVRARSIDLSAIDGAGASVELRGVGTGSRIDIRDDVGANAALERFDADADLLVFGTRTEAGKVVTSADRVVANEVTLNNTLPVSTIADTATIADTNGGLSIESAGDVTMGAGEKLSSTAVLAIHAGGKASLGDLSATELSVDAAQIEILGRPPGPVAGAAIPVDHGVDWVANDITTNVVPLWDGKDAPPTFVLGSGGIRTGGVIPYDVVRFTPRGDEIKPANFVGSDTRVLDLTGTGPRAVSDARNDLPRSAPPVLPALAARAGDEPPSPPRAVSSEEVIGALHCRTGSGDVCAPPAIGDDPLATEHALELRQRYRALLATDEAKQSLRSAFAPLAPRGGDAAALPQALAHDPALGDARARIAELAVALAQVELLGLEPEQSERVRHAVAADFAAASGVAALDADAVLAAVDASGVAVLP
ncbi:MAG: hypothetical protein E6J87_23945 [Deltaproteobacteria bacterium]|nr:MAG: hypothetical protein E6J87_23945 [Deltaproteobacteria bacterium]